MAASTQWQTELSQLSLKKQQKFDTLARIIPDCSGRKCLEIGSETGVLVDFLQKVKGGEWFAGALEQRWVDESEALLGKNVVLIDPRQIDFQDESFDLIVASRPEHIDDDRLFFKEVFRIMRPGGTLVVTSPHDGRLLWLNDVKEGIGLTMEQYDHYRRGYSSTMLRERLSRAGFDEIHVGSYCRFFSELIEMSLNAAYVFVNKRKAKDRSARDLSYRPTSKDDMQSNKGIFALYRMVYPLLFLISRLDSLLFFTNGYVIFATARRP